MDFVKVSHTDGRTAEITPAEVAFYRSIGFAPVDGAAVELAAAGDAASAANDRPQAATSGTDQRLDLVLGELRGIRAEMAKRLDRFADEFAAFRGEWLSPETLDVTPIGGEPETVELRGAGTTSTTTTPAPTTSTTTTAKPTTSTTTTTPKP